MNDSIKETIEATKRKTSLPIVSTILADGSIVEMAYEPEPLRTLFYIGKDSEYRQERELVVNGQRLVPYSPRNNLIQNEVVLLPSKPVEYGSEQQLVQEISAFIHRYVEVSPFFEKLACYYVLFSWVFDGFNELPYLRVRGDFGTGKTRFLLTVGSLCYKPIFASGASTVSPLFRILDAFKGTLIIDESDFRFSDEKAEIVKILNNGNVKGFPVLRSEVSGRGEFNPKAYHVFGPKLVASRGVFDDRALESRFLTEELGQSKLREDIPINLPMQHKLEALELRNKLLLFRFRNLNKHQLSESLVDRSIEPRLNQIFAPLLSIIDDSEVRKSLRELARQYNRELVNDRGLDMEAQILEVIRSLLATPENDLVSLADITRRFVEVYGEEYERKVTNKRIGFIVRKKLNLKTHKSDGVSVIPIEELPKLKRLYEKYGIGSKDEPKSDGAEVEHEGPHRLQGL
jgi:hypothetical protein